MSKFFDTASQGRMVIAALHLPPLPGSGHPDRRSMSEIIEYAIRNTDKAVTAGVNALYIQDLGDHPWSSEVHLHTVATMSAVGARLRKEFPSLHLGVCLLSHGAREPIAIAQAIDAQFVRLKVYIGAMVKAEGILEGCAPEAINYRAQVRADDIAILADVFDRTGVPLGEMALGEAAKAAAVFGRADGLIITGRSFAESVEMLKEVRYEKTGVPLLLGGGATPDNISEVMDLAQGVIVSSAFKPIGDWSRSSLDADWEQALIEKFMKEVQGT